MPIKCNVMHFAMHFICHYFNLTILSRHSLTVPCAPNKNRMNATLQSIKRNGHEYSTEKPRPFTQYCVVLLVCIVDVVVMTTATMQKHSTADSPRAYTSDVFAFYHLLFLCFRVKRFALFLSLSPPVFPCASQKCDAKCT